MVKWFKGLFSIDKSQDYTNMTPFEILEHQLINGEWKYNREVGRITRKGKQLIVNDRNAYLDYWDGYIIHKLLNDDDKKLLRPHVDKIMGLGITLDEIIK